MPENRCFADGPADSPTAPVSVIFYLLGTVSLDSYLALQRRLVYELGDDSRARIPVLICEHPPMITVGRRGSRADIRFSGQQLRWRQLPVHWVSRGGGCILHGPGQLTIAPLVPLANTGWSLGEFHRRLQQGLLSAFQALAIPVRPGNRDWGIWGRSGQLAAVGISVRNAVTQFGIYLNVNPSMSSYHYVAVPESSRPTGTPLGRTDRMGCLLSEKSQGVKMTQVRASMMEHLSAAWGAEHYHILTGHPFLEKSTSATRGTNVRAS